MPNKRKYTSIDQVPGNDLKQKKHCSHGHQMPDGNVVTLKTTGVCIGCYFNVPDGPLNYQFEGYEPLKLPESKYKTVGEKRRARSLASMRWTKKNQDKRHEYQNRYNSKEEIKEKYRAYHNGRYNELREKAKNDPALAAWMKERAHQAYLKKKAKRLEGEKNGTNT